MQQPQRHIPSVSDLYGTDEIEFLLDEIRDLEPACCQLDDVQDFEIAGSRAGELSLSLANNNQPNHHHQHHHHHNNHHGTHDGAHSPGQAQSNAVESPLGTITSWDSHIHYRQRLTPLPWGVALHCDAQHLKSPTGIVRLLLVLSSAACLACECSAGTVQVGLFLLPLIGRLRLMVFCALFSLLITCLMLFLDISHIALMFPFNWGKVNAYLYLSVGLFFIVGASLLLHMVLYAESFMWVPRHTKDTLFVSALIGYGCAAEALLLSGIAFYPTIVRKYRRVPDADCEELMFADDGCDGREMSPMSPLTSSDGPLMHHHNNSGGNHHQHPHPHPNHNPYHQRQHPPAGNFASDDDDNDYSAHNNHHDNNHHHHNHHNNQQYNNHHHNNHHQHGNNHHHHHNNDNLSNSVTSMSTHKPYIPAERPDQVNNRRPTLGHHTATIQSKTNTRYRQGYHYQPILTTSQRSPTFVLETPHFPPTTTTTPDDHTTHHHHHHHQHQHQQHRQHRQHRHNIDDDAIVDCPVSSTTAAEADNDRDNDECGEGNESKVVATAEVDVNDVDDNNDDAGPKVA